MGRVIGGRFEVEGETHAGGMGVVQRARDLHTGEVVAVKLLLGSSRADTDRFAREATVLASLSHPGIVRYVSHGLMPTGAPYLAMEWLTGITLSERLQRGPLGLADSVRLARRIAEALGEAHRRGVVHRDIKPSNLFLPDEDLGRAKVLDFGIARQARDGRAALTATGAAIGTPGYMAPEQARGHTGGEHSDEQRAARAVTLPPELGMTSGGSGGSTVAAASDVFSLGCVLYECITGAPAFLSDHPLGLLAKILLEEPPTLRERGIEAPPILEDLLGRMLAKDPADRPRDGTVLAAELSGSGAARLTPSRPALTALMADEARVVCVLLASAPVGRGRASIEATRRATETLAGFDARVEVLADRSLLALVSGGGTATDHAGRAARCALALRSAAPDRAIVLAAGRAAVAGDRLPLGDVIDRAARALGRVPTGVIGVDAATAGLLDARFEVRAANDSFVLATERDREQPRTLLGKVVPCAGRDRELGLLDGFLAECVAESVARAVLVTAPAGAGKSRLLHEFLRRVEALTPGVGVLLGRGDPLALGSPFGLLGPALRRAAGVLEGEPLEARRAKLAARLGRHLVGARKDRVCEFLGELARVPFDDGQSDSLRSARGDAQLMGDAMRAAWEDWLRAECAAGPVVLVLEDLHWGDLPTVTFTDVALRNLRELPLLVLALARPEVHDLFPGLWADRELQQLRLAPLTRRAAEKIVTDSLGPTVSRTLLDRLVARAEGNAFYLEELIRAVAAGAGRELPEALPDTLLGMVEARLDALGPEARRVLRAGSVFGHGFSTAGVAAVLVGDNPSTAVPGTPGGTRVGAGSLDEWLAELVAREIVDRRIAREGAAAGDVELVFRQDLLREAAYATLTDDARRRAHGLAGEWLERTGESDPAVLAGHYDRSGDPPRAARWFRRGAEQALEGNDLLAAIFRAERAIACGTEGSALGALWLIQAEARRWRGEPALAAADAARALPLLIAGTAAWYQAAGELIVASGQIGDNDTVLRWVRAAGATLAERGAASAQLVCLCRGAAQLIQAGRHAPADEILSRLDALAGDLSHVDRLAVARLHRVRAKRALHAGDVGGFLRGQEAAVEAFDLAGDSRNACSERGDLGFAYAELGDYERAEEVLTSALTGAEHMGLKHVAPYAWNNLGLVLAYRPAHDLVQAQIVEQRAIDAGVEHGNRRLEGGSRIQMAVILHRAGDGPGAEREARRAAQLLEVAPPRRGAAVAMIARALVLQGRALEALPPAHEAMRLLEQLGGMDEGESLVWLGLIEAQSATGDEPGAAATIAAAARRLVERAGRITDPARRESFLHRVPENARLLELARG